MGCQAVPAADGEALGISLVSECGGECLMIIIHRFCCFCALVSQQVLSWKDHYILWPRVEQELKYVPFCQRVHVCAHVLSNVRIGTCLLHGCGEGCIDGAMNPLMSDLSFVGVACFFQLCTDLNS